MNSRFKTTILLLTCFTKLITCPVEMTKGASPQILSFYDSRKNFTCLDGSLTIHFSYINDDYCDCPDSTDEPGTSACHHGNFHCLNKDHEPQDIPSAFVNDGICDCCDGTDEYDGAVCPNTCKTLAEEKEMLRKQHREGNLIREKMIVLGRDTIEQKLERKRRLENEIKEIEYVIEKFERENMNKINKTKLISNVQRGNYTVIPLESSSVIDGDTDSGVLEGSSPISNISSEYNAKKPQVFSETASEKKLNGENVLIENGVHVQKQQSAEEDKSSQYLSLVNTKENKNRELSEIDGYLSTDFGIEEEYAPLYNQCFTLRDPQYLYTFCPFAVVTQTDKAGKNEVALGFWGDWIGENYNLMFYQDGHLCGNGLKRSTTVVINCGLKTQIELVKEPERCRYEIHFNTPAACKVQNVIDFHDEL